MDSTPADTTYFSHMHARMHTHTRTHDTQQVKWHTDLAQRGRIWTDDSSRQFKCSGFKCMQWVINYLRVARYNRFLQWHHSRSLYHLPLHRCLPWSMLPLLPQTTGGSTHFETSPRRNLYNMLDSVLYSFFFTLTKCLASQPVNKPFW